MLVLPPEVDVRHIPVPKVTVAERLQLLRRLLRRGSFNFDEAVDGRRPRDRRGDAVLAARALQAG